MAFANVHLARMNGRPANNPRTIASFSRLSDRVCGNPHNFRVRFPSPRVTVPRAPQRGTFVCFAVLLGSSHVGKDQLSPHDTGTILFSLGEHMKKHLLVLSALAAAIFAGAGSARAALQLRLATAGATTINVTD